VGPSTSSELAGCHNRSIWCAKESCSTVPFAPKVCERSPDRSDEAENRRHEIVESPGDDVPKHGFRTPSATKNHCGSRKAS
jgi:hypothetical protein